MSDKMRELFEKWAIANGLNVSWRSGDDYLVDGTITAWAAWQAAQSAAVPVVGEPVAQNPSRMCVVFDGPPSSEAPRFIEVEDGNGNSINAGEWLKRDDGLWELRLIAPLPLSASTAISITAAELDALRKDAERKEDLGRTMRHLKKTMEKLEKYRLCMSYNDSYFGEPAGTVKAVTLELSHCIDAAIAGEKK